MNNKKIILRITFLLFYCLVFNFCEAQKEKEKMFLLDSNFNYIKTVDESKYFLIKEKLNDSLHKFTYYKTATLRALSVEHYTDEEGAIANGIFGYYNPYNGQLDSMGNVLDGRRDKSWFFYDAFSKNPDSVIESKTYKNGILQAKQKKQVFDSLTIEKEASFNGNFKKLLEQNLKYPSEAQNMKAQGIVKLLFTVNTNGELLDLIFAKSVNYFLDKEANRVILKSNRKWNPGTVNGQPVNSFHLQSIAFVLAEN